MPPWMVPRLSVVRDSSGSGVSASAARAVANRGDRVGSSGIGKAVAAGSGDGRPDIGGCPEPASRLRRRPGHPEQCARRCGPRVGCAHRYAARRASRPRLLRQRCRGSRAAPAARHRRGGARQTTANIPATPAALSHAPGASRRSPSSTGLSGVPAGKTVSMCAESRMTGPVLSAGMFVARQGAENVAGSVDLDIAEAGLVKRSASHSARLRSPCVGAGMATSSTCQSMMVLGFACSQAKAA